MWERNLEHVRKPSFVVKLQNFELQPLRPDEGVLGESTQRSGKTVGAEIMRLQQNMGFPNMLYNNDV